MDFVNCNTPCICKIAPMSVNPHDCDDMLHESMGVINISNVKLLKKKVKKFHENLSKFICKNDDLIAKINKSNKLVEKYKKLAEFFFEKMKIFVAIMLWYPILCLLCVLAQMTNPCTFLYTKG